MSDAGVAALAVLVQLREVSLAGTMVSEQGLSLLEAQRRLRRAQCTPHYLRLAEAPAANLVGACA